MNLDRARSALARVPWVRSVALRRQWPQRLEVTIEEHAPLARWNDDGARQRAGRGVRRRLRRRAAAVRRAGRQRRRGGGALSASGARRSRRSRSTLEGIRLSPRGGWRLAARGAGGALAIELGRDEPAARLARFVAAYGRTIGALARAGTRIEHVDLRYRNGFAARVPGFRERAAEESRGRGAAANKGTG